MHCSAPIGLETTTVAAQRTMEHDANPVFDESCRLWSWVISIGSKTTGPADQRGHAAECSHENTRRSNQVSCAVANEHSLGHIIRFACGSEISGANLCWRSLHHRTTVELLRDNRVAIAFANRLRVLQRSYSKTSNPLSLAVGDLRFLTMIDVFVQPQL